MNCTHRPEYDLFRDLFLHGTVDWASWAKMDKAFVIACVEYARMTGYKRLADRLATVLPKPERKLEWSIQVHSVARRVRLSFGKKKEKGTLRIASPCWTKSEDALQWMRHISTVDGSPWYPLAFIYGRHFGWGTSGSDATSLLPEELLGLDWLTDCSKWLLVRYGQIRREGRAVVVLSPGALNLKDQQKPGLVKTSWKIARHDELGDALVYIREKEMAHPAAAEARRIGREQWYAGLDGTVVLHADHDEVQPLTQVLKDEDGR